MFLNLLLDLVLIDSWLAMPMMTVLEGAMQLEWLNTLHISVCINFLVLVTDVVVGMSTMQVVAMISR